MELNCFVNFAGFRQSKRHRQLLAIAGYAALLNGSFHANAQEGVKEADDKKDPVVQVVLDKNNAVSQAEDGFGNQAGKESIGVYGDDNVRGFSPRVAGNLRIEGMYFDRRAYLGHLLLDGSKVRVGTTVTAYPFPAPTGIVDYQLRKVGDEFEFSHSIEAERSARGVGDLGADINALLPLTAKNATLKMGLSLATSLYRDMSSHQDASLYRSAALVGRIRSDAFGGFELLPFYSDDVAKYSTPETLWLTQEGQLPPESVYHLKNPVDLKAGWMRGHGWSRTSGAIFTQNLSEQWKLRSSFIRSQSHNPRAENHMLEQVDEHTWSNTYFSEKNNQSLGDSTELRLSHAAVSSNARQQWHLVWRARKTEQFYGGEAELDLGRVQIRDRRAQLAYPAHVDFDYGERQLDRVQQRNWGVAYDYRQEGLSLNAGVMKSFYDKRTWTGAGNERRFVGVQDKPLLKYANFSWDWGQTWSIYGGYTQGLEESGVAPVSANNRFTALPAIHTKQRDLGLRWKWQTGERQLNAVLGAFEVSKPHFGMNAQQNYEMIGQVVHRGVEASLSGKLTDELSVVMAAVYLDAGVSHAQNAHKTRPAGSVPIEWHSYFEYSLPEWKNTSLDFGWQYLGAQTSSELRGTKLDNKVLAQIGLRHQWDIGHANMQFRFQITNLFDRVNWEVESANTFRPSEARSYRLVLTTTY